MHCPECHGEDCIHIEIRLKGDETIQFYSCRLCEAKWWERDGDAVALDEVLHLTTQKESK